MLEELVGEGAQPGGEGEEMVVICIPATEHAEERPSGDKLKDKAAEAPNVKGFVDGIGKNLLGGSEAEWSKGLCRRVRKKICC